MAAGGGFTKKIFREQSGSFGGLDGSGEYFVNLGLFNNDKVSALSFEVNELVNELATLLPDMPFVNDAARNKRFRDINVIYPTLNRKFRTLIGETVGVLKKMDITSKNTTYMAKVQTGLRLCDTPMPNVKLKKFVKAVFEYNEMLQIAGIVPITAGYTGESGESSLMRQ